jgi:hypothetical protein
MEAIHEALAIDKPVASLEALVGATCAIWGDPRDIHEQLQAIVVLEPDAAPRSMSTGSNSVAIFRA